MAELFVKRDLEVSCPAGFPVNQMLGEWDGVEWGGVFVLGIR